MASMLSAVRWPCPMKAALRTYTRTTKDTIYLLRTTCAPHSKKGQSEGPLQRCVISESDKTAEVNKIDGFSKLHNFCYEDKGVRVWRSYCVGSGKLMSYESLCVKSQWPTNLTTREGFFDVKQSWVLKPDCVRPTDDNQPFSSWPEPRCKCVFAAFVDLELHLDVGEHDVEV